MAPRKLSFPQDSYRTSKKPKIEQHSQPSNAKKMQQSRGSSSGNISNNNPSRIFHRTRTNSSRGYTHTIPKDMPCCFKPTVDMNLTFKETRVCAYVFNPNVDPREGNNLGTRKTFQSLCPNKPVREEVYGSSETMIILFMALKVAYSQLYCTRSVWCMPPAFAVDVINGCPVETLIQHYGKDWMPPFSNLNLTNVMLSVLEIVFPTQEFVIGFDGMDCWDIAEARGIPNCGSSEKSALWVLEWMQMEELFISLLYGVIQYPVNPQPLILQFTAPFHNNTDTIEVPYFYHRQWQVYPCFVRLRYHGTTFYIRLRQHHNKVYFADGLNHLRKDLAIYEFVTITFLAMENKSTFDIYFTPDLQHQSCGRPLLFSREYVWTIQISQSMLGAPGPLRLPNCVMPHVNACSQHMTILKKVGPPLQWNVEVLHGMNRYVIEPWYQFLRDTDSSHGDEEEREVADLAICPQSSTNLGFLSSFVSIVLNGHNALLRSFYCDEDNALLESRLLLRESKTVVKGCFETSKARGGIADTQVEASIYYQLQGKNKDR
ncbi:hypothetical protein JHK85_006747 [Glycine max]|nr:hypothetical protein JHK85_006747 [Glycine max]